MKGKPQRVLVIDDDRGRPIHELLREYAALHDTSPPLCSVDQNAELAKLAKAFTQGVIVGMSETPNTAISS